MSTELEDEIRSALRASAESVTRDRLRYAAAPRARHHRRTLYAALAAAAVVVAIAIGASFWTANRRSTPVGGTTANTLAGTGWRLVSVTGPHGTVVFPSPPPADVQFFAGGRFATEDGVNSCMGDYRSTPTGIAVSQVFCSGAGYAGSDPLVLARMAGIGALTADGEVATLRQDDHLTLRAGRYTLRLNYGGAAYLAPVSGMSSASNTPS